MSHPRTPDEPPREAFPGPPTAAPGGFTGSPPTAPSAPTATSAPSSQPTGAGPDQEYYVAPGPPPASAGGTYAHLGRPVPQPQPEPDSRGAKAWIIPVAGLLALAMIAAAVYFLFLQDDGPAEDQAGGSSTSAGRSAASGSDGSAASPAPVPEITGSYEVTGTIASYTGPQTGQLGTSARKPGDPAFKTPQTWTIAGGCTGADDCELTITPGDDTVALTLDGETWTGQTQIPIQCTAAGPQSNATVVIEIDPGGATATRTVTAGCAQQVVEIDDLVLTAK